MFNKKSGVLIFSIVVVMTALLAGCGSKDNNAAPAAGSPDAAMRTIKTEKGDVEVPGEPKKVATLVGSFADDLLTLGITPHAVDAGEGNSFKDNGYLKDKLHNAVLLGSTWTPNLEAILQAEPDLIISHLAVHEKAYGDMSKIAPTILFNPDAVGWREELKFVGEVVGKQELAQQKLDEYDASVAAAKEKLQQKGINEKTVLFLRVLPKEIRVYGGTSPQGTILYEDLGLKPADNIPLMEHAESIAMEKLPDIDPDILFLMDNTEDKLEAFKSNPLWQNLKAVKNGTVYLAGKDVWPWGSYLARTQAIDYIVDTLAN